MKYKVIHQLKERRFASISKSEEAVLDYFEKHFNEIPKLSVIELSEQSYTSQATINRACKVLGFNGFSELKYAIKEDLQYLNIQNKNYMSKAEFFIEKINFDSVKNITKHFTDRNVKLMIYGLGASKISAQYFHRQLLYLGIPALLISEEKMLEYFHDYILLILSSSGETVRIKQVAKEAKKSGMMVLSITKKDSTLAQLSNDVFSHEVSVHKLEGISREQQLHMIIMVNELTEQIANMLDSKSD